MTIPLPVKIKGSGMYLPPTQITAADIDQELGLSPGTALKMSGVRKRHRANGMTAAEMGAIAAREALERAELTFDDIDLVVSATCPSQRLLPCTAVLIQKEMGGGDSGTYCIDIDATCSSFLAALEFSSYGIALERYRNVLLVSSSVTSNGLNPDTPKSYALFGDASAAFVVGHADEGDSSAFCSSHSESYGNLCDASTVIGGGTQLLGNQFSEENRELFFFQMDGKTLVKGVLRYIKPCIDLALENAEQTMEDLQLVVPHQASPALEMLRNLLGLPHEKWMLILENHGNCIAAGIPLALHTAITEGRIQRGDVFMLIGMAAGLTVGSQILRY